MDKLQAIAFLNTISGIAVYPCEYCARKGFDNSCTDYCSQYRNFIRSEAKRIESEVVE